MLRWWWVLLQAARLTSAARSSGGDPCADLCRPGEDGGCVYWPSTNTYRADLAELFCANCTGPDEVCFGSPLCGEMCRFVHGKCAYHPSLSSTHNVEDAYCGSCHYCGELGSRAYFTKQRLRQDQRILRTAEDLKEQTDKELADTEAALERTGNASTAITEALAGWPDKERNETEKHGRLDDGLVSMIASQAVQESKLKLEAMKREAQRLASEAAGAEQRLEKTGDTLWETDEAAQETAEAVRRSKIFQEEADTREKEGHVLEDAAKLAALRGESLRFGSVAQQAQDRADETLDLASQVDSAAKEMGDKATGAKSLQTSSEKIAKIEEHVAQLAGQEVAAVPIAEHIHQKLDLATHQTARYQEGLDEIESARDFAKATATQAKETAESALQVADAEGSIAKSAGQEVSAVLVSEGLRYLQDRAGQDLEEVSRHIRGHEASEEQLAKRAEAPETIEEASALAAQHAKQAALDAGASFANALHDQLETGAHHKAKPPPEVKPPSVKQDPSPSPRDATPLTVKEVITPIFPQLLPQLQVLGLAA